MVGTRVLGGHGENRVQRITQRVSYAVEVLDWRYPETFQESFSNYKARVEQVFNYLEDFPEPCLRGERPDYDPEGDEVKQTPVEPKVVRLAIFESLPARWRDMYDNRETADCRKLTEAEFMATMIKIEEQENAARVASKKHKAPSPSPGKKRKDGNQNSQDGKKRPKRFCQKCKDLG